jgi:hypothetical protein
LSVSTAGLLSSGGALQAGVQLTEAAAGMLQPYLSSRADDALLSVYGTLFLTDAVATSRADDRQTATAFLNEAQESASRLGRNPRLGRWTVPSGHIEPATGRIEHAGDRAGPAVLC